MRRLTGTLVPYAALALAVSLAGAGCSSAGTPSETTGNVSEGLSICGPTPLATTCNLPRCTPDGWEFYPMPAGSGCKTAAGVAGVCDGGVHGDDVGHCNPTPTYSGTAFPSYYVLALLYSAPGNGSEVDYGAQSTIGSEVDVQNLVKAGVQITAAGKIAGVGTTVQVGFAGGPVDGSSWEISKTQSSTLSLTSQEDPLTHGNDTFYLWTNAEIDMTQVGTAPVVTTLASRGGAAPIIVPVTVAELRDPSVIPPWKQQYLAALTAQDYSSIMKLDPLATTRPIAITPVLAAPPDPARFEKVTTLQLDGPDHAGDPVDGFGISLTHEHTDGQVSGYNTATTASISFDTGFNLFGVLSSNVQVAATFEWDYQKLTQTKDGSSQTAAVTLKTTTVGYHAVVDVYFDTLFNSFAFVPPTSAPVTLGVARAL